MTGFAADKYVALGGIRFYNQGTMISSGNVISDNVLSGQTEKFTVTSSSTFNASGYFHPINVVDPPASNLSLDVFASSYDLNAGGTVDVEVKLSNATDIYAEDFTIQYDPTAFELVSEVVSDTVAYQIMHTVKTSGQARYIVASNGGTYGITGGITDVNGDEKFTLGDLAIASNLLETLSSEWGSFTPDVDVNGTVEATDLNLIVTEILK